MVQQRCVNPFFHRIHVDPDQYLSVILGSIFLAPIRLILTIFLFVIASLQARFYTFLLGFIDKAEDPDKYHRYRHIYKTHLVYVFRTILFVCGFYKVTIIQKGDPKNEDDAPIYIFAPHTSLFDILAGVAFNAPSSVAKADIVDIPLFGNIFKLSDPILVERDSKDSRHDVFKKVADAIKYSKIVFFPEGTCSNHRVLLQFKNGAFKFGYPVIPVAIRFNQYGGPDTLSWTWDGPSTISSIWLTLARWRTDMEITKLPVYYPSEEEKTNPDLYASNVTKVLTKELRIPCLFYSFDDARYFKYDFFRSSACVKFFKLVDKVRQMRAVTVNAGQSKVSNKTNANSAKQGTKTRETLFTNFLYQYIDEVDENLKNNDLNSVISLETLVKALNIESTPSISSSYALKEFMYSLTKISKNVTLVHLRIVLNLVDLRVENLWERMSNCYELLMNADQSDSLTFDSLKMLLWLSLSLQDVDNDTEIQNIKIISFDDLKNLIINYYDFALRENAKSICQETTTTTSGPNRR